MLIQGLTAQANYNDLKYLSNIKIVPQVRRYISIFVPEKFGIIYFTKDPILAEEAKTTSLQLGSIDPIELLKSLYILGIYLDPELTYSSYRAYIKSTASYRINYLQVIYGSTQGFSLLKAQKLYLSTIILALLYGYSIQYTPYKGNGIKT